MPFGSSFPGTLIPFLAAANSPSKEVSALTIASAYYTDALLVMPTLIPGATALSLPGPSGIEAGFIQSFTLAEQIKEGEPTPEVWVPAATSIVTFWTGAQFNPLIPAPGGLLGANNSVLFAGEPSSLASAIWTAMKAGLPAVTSIDGATLVANALNAAFISHLTTVSGLWSGTAPGAPPIPYIFPWVGLT